MLFSFNLRFVYAYYSLKQSFTLSSAYRVKIHQLVLSERMFEHLEAFNAIFIFLNFNQRFMFALAVSFQKSKILNS